MISRIVVIILAFSLGWTGLPASASSPTTTSARASASHPSASHATAASRADVSQRTPQGVDRFGIQKGVYTVEEKTVRRYQTFADLLRNYGVPYKRIVDLAREVRPLFDVRDVQAGKNYSVYVNPWLERARYLIYQQDAVNYVVLDVRHPEKSRLGQRPVSVAWRTITGEIDNSLYQSMVDAGAQPELALHLSEVFAWQIDFFRIQPGDAFRVVYEERTVDETRIRPGEIIAAYVQHQGEEYYGFRFDEGEGSEYFDLEGNSLRRELLKAPLRFNRISSRFSHRRLHPVLKRYRPHHGTDYAAPTGTPVHSVGDGVVLFAARKGYNGNYVKIRHNATFESGYLHLNRIADGITKGTKVEQGQTIGYVGSTGLSTGPHLDYRLWKNGAPIDPYTIDLPPARPVAPEHRIAYDQLVEHFMDLLHEEKPLLSSLS